MYITYIRSQNLDLVVCFVQSWGTVDGGRYVSFFIQNTHIREKNKIFNKYIYTKFTIVLT